MRKYIIRFSSLLLLALVLSTGGNAQSLIDYEYSVMGYSEEAEDNPVARLALRLSRGELELEYNERYGYFESFLEELGIDPNSQTLVFSKTSLQHRLITAATPRALYFSDDTYIGWVLGSDIVEIATMDERFGLVFYIFNNVLEPEQAFERETQSCLVCHDSYGMMGGGVPLLMALSSVYTVDGISLSSRGGGDTTDRTPLEDRWGGWYVTGQHGDQQHLGNVMLPDRYSLDSLDDARLGNVDTLSELGLFDSAPYLAETSDIVALLVLEHQLTVQNQFTYIKFKAPVVLERLGHGDAARASSWSEMPTDAQRVLTRMLDELVDHMLFVEAAGFDGHIEGSDSYVSSFMARGPITVDGLSLRELDLNASLFKYPLSYLIYSRDFDTLPAYAKDYVYMRLTEILEGREYGEEFEHLSSELRRSIVQILIETKPDILDYLSGVDF